MLNIVCDPLELRNLPADGSNWRLEQAMRNEHLHRKTLMDLKGYSAYCI